MAFVTFLEMHTRRLVALVFVFAYAGFLAAPSPATATPPPRAPTLFVLRGPTRSISGGLSVRTRSVEWFTDRPERRAGTMTARALVRGWQAWGFADDPPNAALTGHDLDVVVELSAPRVRNGRLHFHVAPVRGRLPRGKLGAVSAFVDATSTATTSTVQIVNNSGEQTTAFVYVTFPYLNTETQPQPLSWLTTQLFPGTSSSLEWDASTQLMWGEAGSVQTGMVFEAKQTLSVPPAGPGQTGTADLTQENGNFSLTTDPTENLPWGSLAVNATQSTSYANVVLALGLSGSPALLTQAEFGSTMFPGAGFTYWLSNSDFIDSGEVFGTFETSNAVQLNFTPGVTSLTATLNANNNWTVQPS